MNEPSYTKLFREIDSERKRRPYGAYIDFFLNDDNIQFSLDGPASVLASDEAIVQLDLSPDQPLGPLSRFKRYRANIEGFTTACEAEVMGLKLSLALLGLPLLNTLECGSIITRLFRAQFMIELKSAAGSPCVDT